MCLPVFLAPYTRGGQAAHFLNAFGRLARRSKRLGAIRKLLIEVLYLGALQGAQKELVKFAMDKRVETYSAFRIKLSALKVDSPAYCAMHSADKSLLGRNFKIDVRGMSLHHVP